MKYPLELAQFIIQALLPTVNLLENRGGSAFRLRASKFQLALTETKVLLLSGEYESGWYLSISGGLMRIRWNRLLNEVVRFHLGDWSDRFTRGLSPLAANIDTRVLPTVFAFAVEDCGREKGRKAETGRPTRFGRRPG